MRVGYFEIFDLDICRVCTISDAVLAQMSKQLNAQQTVERHEEEEEQRYVVDLLRGSLEDLVDSLLRHIELQGDPDEPHEDERSRRPQAGQEAVAVHESGDLEAVQNNRNDEEKEHNSVELCVGGNGR